MENILSVGQYSNVFLRSIWLGALASVDCIIHLKPATSTIIS